MINDDIEKEATVFADENWEEYFCSEEGDYKYAWCQAYKEYIENQIGEDDV